MLLKCAIFNCCSQLGIRGIVVNVLACISFGTCTCWAMMYTWPWSKGFPTSWSFKYAFSIRCLGEVWGWNVLSPLVWASWRGRNLYGSWQNQTPVALFPHHPSCTETARCWSVTWNGICLLDWLSLLEGKLFKSQWDKRALSTDQFVVLKEILKVRLDWQKRCVPQK